MKLNAISSSNQPAELIVVATLPAPWLWKTNNSSDLSQQGDSHRKAKSRMERRHVSEGPLKDGAAHERRSAILAKD